MNPDKIEWHQRCDVLLSNIGNMPVTEKNYVKFEKDFEILKDYPGLDKKRFKSSYFDFLVKYKHYTEAK